MRQTKPVLALLALCPLALGSGRALSAAPDRAADIRKTTEAVLRADAPEGSVGKALAHLVEIAGAIGRDARLAGEARAKLDAAVRETSPGSVLSPATRTVLADAYAALNGGVPFAFPGTVKTIDGARAFVRSLSEKSAKALEAGRSADAARDLVGAVLVTVTSMEAPL